jgi:hypothetical protein
MIGTTTTISISRNPTSRPKLRTAVRARTALIKFSDRYDIAVMCARIPLCLNPIASPATIAA